MEKLSEKAEIKQFYYFVLALAWNEVVARGGQLSTAQQEDLVKVTCQDWIEVLKKDYDYVPRSDCVTNADWSF